MSKRLDPSGLAGAFATKGSSSAFEFLVPVRPHRTAPAASTTRPRSADLDRWAPGTPPSKPVGRLRRVVHRLQRLVGRALRIAL